jgi:hypothetical protein
MTPIPLGILALSGVFASGAFDLLETTTLTTSASSVTFSGLGAYSDYKHLQVRVIAGIDNTSTSLLDSALQFNGDTGSNYSHHFLFGNGSAVSSSALTSQVRILLGNSAAGDSPTSSLYAATVLDILDFSSNSKNTTTRAFSGGVSSEKDVRLTSGLWQDTNPITSVLLSATAVGGYASGSRFSLYGVK